MTKSVRNTKKSVINSNLGFNQKDWDKRAYKREVTQSRNNQKRYSGKKLQKQCYMRELPKQTLAEQQHRITQENKVIDIFFPLDDKFYSFKRSLSNRIKLE